MLFRTAVLTAAAALVLSTAPASAELAGSAGQAAPMAVAPAQVLLAAEAEVFKAAGCGCCGGWIEHVRKHGLEPLVHDVDGDEMARIKSEAGITPELTSCHTALIDGYVVEGHVPAADIARLLADRPDALGLAAPGMPAGSPGMDGGAAEAYDVLLVLEGGRTEVFATH